MTKEKRSPGRPKGAKQLGRADDVQIQALMAAGYTPTQIAGLIGRGRATVYNRIAAIEAAPLLPLPVVQQ